jgi:quinol monooxygenase YgiN
MHIVIAPFRPKQGVTEDVVLQTSQNFEEQFVRKQDGILKRIVVKDGEGGYADIVFFKDAAAIDRVIQAEQNSDVCAALIALIEDDHPHIYEALKTYE